MSIFIKCLFGPRLFRIYRHGAEEGHAYEANILESLCDLVIRTAFFSFSMAWSLGFYMCPIIAGYMYRKGYFTTDYFHSVARMSGTLGVLLCGAYSLRGVGRMMNSDYLRFIELLTNYRRSSSVALKEQLEHFDYDFSQVEVAFRWNSSGVTESSVLESRRNLEPLSFSGNSLWEKIKDFPLSWGSYFAIHSFGRGLIYPGSVSLIQSIFSPALRQGRTKLIEQLGGKRNKLLSMDGNEIDTMFLDRRNDNHFPNGSMLVICCEGNSGFYEMGIMGSPIEAGFSVLGWNHPGFFDSTGLPYPSQEANGIDVVFRFAIHKLNFKVENIVIYAWSIGGFTATWAAMNYPNIKGLILDASFDNLVPLAIARMPPVIEKLVVRAIREHMNLDNAAQALKYDGPVILVRRSRDEMITTRPSRPLQTNRGNNLLKKILRHRYPHIFTNDTVWVLDEWLFGGKTQQTMLWSQHEVNESLCRETIQAYISQNSAEFPMKLGQGMPEDLKLQFVLYLADKHMYDFDSTHCVPLPPRIFRLPWDPLSTNEE